MWAKSWGGGEHVLDMKEVFFIASPPKPISSRPSEPTSQN